MNVSTLEDVKKEILEFCKEPQSKSDILGHIQVEINQNNYHKFVVSLLDQRFISNGLFRRRSSIKQQFVITQKGLNYLKAIS
ncbi:winged helix-turn-helix domain-containing protein [Adhaeribacter aquaticus]|uniref:winged helix-turn-helix domain-containing protein n=1 Tax=Adhaeribacter aquaticus TaxID=299567 RepID=UPI0003FB5A98|nr:winged helix-turn-helix domain-containing protein [Adhaeribacter aquaticus]